MSTKEEPVGDAKPPATFKKAAAKLTDDQLAAERDSLASLRTTIRLRQNEVQAEIDIRAAIAGLPDESRRIVKIRLEGGIAPTGDASTGGG